VDERKVERVDVDGMELHVEPVDESDENPGGVHTALPPRVESWRRRSVTGAVLTGFAFGLREVLEPEREETAIIVQVSGEPVGDLPVEAQLNERQPGESVVTVRPWLLAEPVGGAGDQQVGADDQPVSAEGQGVGADDQPVRADDQAVGAEDRAVGETRPDGGAEAEGGRREPEEFGSAGSSPDR
jgi:hypothetical protein